MKETNRGIKLSYLGLVICVFITLTTACYIHINTSIAIVVGTTGILSALGWIINFDRAMKVPENIIVVYLLIVMSMLAQNIEEWGFGFSNYTIFKSHVYFPLYSIGLAALFTFGAMGLSVRHHLGNFMSWVIFTWAIIQGLYHYAYPVILNGRFNYIPGQVMSMVLILLGAFGIKRLLTFRSNVVGRV